MEIRALRDVDLKALGHIRGVCLDIDDTLSSHGKLTASAFASLWKLKEAGFVVVPVTGRPAGWCDHIVRFWPVDAVIGENGAFIFYMNNRIRERINLADSSASRVKIATLQKVIMDQFPFAKWASDQAYREYDLAIDICEGVEPWPEAAIETLIDCCRNAGAVCKLSSIHVNAWFGNFDKQSAFQSWLEKGLPGANLALSLENFIYIGDSPNDEPAFQYFPQSVGVANIKQYWQRLKSHPTWVTAQESGRGFEELTEKLLAAKNWA